MGKDQSVEAINLWKEEVEKDQNKVKDGEDRDKNREGGKDRNERGNGDNKDGEIERAGIANLQLTVVQQIPLHCTWPMDQGCHLLLSIPVLFRVKQGSHSGPV